MLIARTAVEIANDLAPDAAGSPTIFRSLVRLSLVPFLVHALGGSDKGTFGAFTWQLVDLLCDARNLTVIVIACPTSSPPPPPLLSPSSSFPPLCDSSTGTLASPTRSIAGLMESYSSSVSFLLVVSPPLSLSLSLPFLASLLLLPLPPPCSSPEELVNARRRTWIAEPLAPKRSIQPESISLGIFSGCCSALANVIGNRQYTQTDKSDDARSMMTDRLRATPFRAYSE